MDELKTRVFATHLKRFEKHGMANIGYWMPKSTNPRTNDLILAYPSREERRETYEGV